MKYELTILSDEQAKIYHIRAQKQFGQTQPSFSDCRSVAVYAVAEYMANLNGWTLYEHSNGKEYETP